MLILLQYSCVLQLLVSLKFLQLVSIQELEVYRMNLDYIHRQLGSIQPPVDILRYRSLQTELEDNIRTVCNPGSWWVWPRSLATSKVPCKYPQQNSRTEKYKNQYCNNILSQSLQFGLLNSSQCNQSHVLLYKMNSHIDECVKHSIENIKFLLYLIVVPTRYTDQSMSLQITSIDGSNQLSGEKT